MPYNAPVQPTDRSAKVTINDVADDAGVSRQTVSNVLNYPQRVHPETLERVKEAIARLGYRPTRAAQQLRSQTAGAIGLEIRAGETIATNRMVMPILTELSAIAARNGSGVVPFASHDEADSVQAYQDLWLSRRVDAFVILDTDAGDARPEWLLESKVPCASFGRVWADPSFTRWTEVDGARGVGDAVRHCVDRGYTRIAHLRWSGTSRLAENRESGWRSAAMLLDLPSDENLVWECREEIDDAIRVGGELIDALAGGEPTAVVCGSDTLAMGVHTALLLRGLRAGRDLGVVGFDGSEMAALHHLTTVVQPAAEIAQSLFSQLVDAMQGAEMPEWGTRVDPQLRIGTSTDRSV